MTVFKYMKLGRSRFYITRSEMELPAWSDGYCVACWDFPTLGM